MPLYFKSPVANNGTATLNFGAAPGTNVVTTAVTGQTGFDATSAEIRLWFNGDDSTATHNAYEHMMAPMIISLSPTSLVSGTGFTITAMTDYRITGTFAVHWSWVN
jgi:hypothetical protein